MPMQLAYVKRLASAFKELFEQSVRRSSGPALMHDHAGQPLDGNTKTDKAYWSLVLLRWNKLEGQCSSSMQILSKTG